MAWTRWLPWRFLVSRVARSLGFLDPLPLVSRLERLAQPSEVAAPVELLRAGALFHARGLLNARVIQYNLDWVWPYWVERQYDPADRAFIPRAFSLTHVNLTHRNWTAVGIPGVDRHPLVDPRGLLTPLYDGWSIDGWLIPDEGQPLLPSRASGVEQELLLGLDGRGSPVPGLAVETRVNGPAGSLVTRVDVLEPEAPLARFRLRADGTRPGWMALAVRPANPEGVSRIERVERTSAGVLRVNGETDIVLDRAPDRVCLSDYARGDVVHAIGRGEASEDGRADARADAGDAEVVCEGGLATAAVLVRLDREGRAELTARVPLSQGSVAEPGAPVGPRRAASGAGAATALTVGAKGVGEASGAWRKALEHVPRFRAPDPALTSLYDAAVRSLVLHAPGDVYPGPYTYKRFWFRDAAFIVDALCCTGLADRARKALGAYPGRQDRSGYFRSQEGEWDSNGAALWTLGRYRDLTGETLPGPWIEAVRRGADWIGGKRLDPGLEAPHAGLLPPGFSAEHLGPNDYFYWDDFWSVAGLRSAARILRDHGHRAGRTAWADQADRWEEEAGDLLASVDRSIARSPGFRRTGAAPASPYRRMDAGAIGCLCASYPLRLWTPDDPRLLATVEHLLEHHTRDNAFFQDMIHSGLNAYLTLHLARTLLRAGDARQEALVRRVAELASKTGHWPEAVHPQTGGGCMGDGQHVWAAAEWVLVMRSWFVREEAGGLVLASGIPRAWVAEGENAAFGPTATPWGPVSVRVAGQAGGARVEWDGDWRGSPPALDVRLPGHRAVTVEHGARHVWVEPRGPARRSEGADRDRGT